MSKIVMLSASTLRNNPDFLTGRVSKIRILGLNVYALIEDVRTKDKPGFFNRQAVSKTRIFRFNADNLNEYFEDLALKCFNYF